MKQAILPFFEYLVFQIAVVIIGLNIVIGKEIDLSGVLKSWILGQMLLYAVLQVIAVPMILARLSFSVLFWTYIGVCIVLFGVGCWGAKKKTWIFRIEKKALTWLSLMLLVFAFILILWQAGNYLFGMHLDEDDARWLAQANDALEYGDLMLRDFDTGEYLGFYQFIKDVVSPWPMFYAVLSRLLFTRTTVFSHTIYAPVALIMMYGVYWLTGEELFEKTEARCTFFLCVAVIHFFFAETGDTQAVFALNRIWQGKASVAAIIIPVLLYLFLCIHKRDKTEDWFRVLMVSCASCLMSGMGILMSAVMIGVYGAYDILFYQRWKRIPFAAFCLIPPVTFYLVSVCIKR